VCTDQVRVVTRQRFCLADEILVGAPDELAARINECDRAVAIVMNHNYALDREQLDMLLYTTARYIGVLGPRARTSRMLNDLHKIHNDSRLHAPIGLEIGAETPHEIALAIVSEVQAVLARAPSQSLRDRVGPIHDPQSMPRIAQEIEAIAVSEPSRPSREIAAVAAPVELVDVEPVTRVSREMAAVAPVA
jgi:xanthine dehydrogenase accessory factor